VSGQTDRQTNRQADPAGKLPDRPPCSKTIPAPGPSVGRSDYTGGHGAAPSMRDPIEWDHAGWETGTKEGRPSHSFQCDFSITVVNNHHFSLFFDRSIVATAAAAVAAATKDGRCLNGHNNSESRRDKHAAIRTDCRTSMGIRTTAKTAAGSTTSTRHALSSSRDPKERNALLHLETALVQVMPSPARLGRSITVVQQPLIDGRGSSANQ
jgi:hypothetical protein